MEYWNFGEERALTLPLMVRSLHGAKLSRAEAGRVCNEISLALGAAWTGGYAHLDVHPGNFLQDGNGQVFLSDFGNALDVSKFRRATIPEALSKTMGAWIKMKIRNELGNRFQKNMTELVSKN